MGLLTAVKAIFGFDGVANSALKIVDKIAGTDWTAKEKAQFVLDHAEKTRYQSPTRRALAIMIGIEWLILVNAWLGFTIYARLAQSSAALLLSIDIAKFLSSDINMLINGIMAFYFLIGMKK